LSLIPSCAAISAFARASRVLGEPALVAPARSAATALLATRSRGRLARYTIDGAAHGDGFLDDYAFLVAGLLDLYETTGEVSWLREAVALQTVLDDRFMVIEQAMGLPKGRDAGLAYAKAFIEEMKASGFVAQALEKSGVRGVPVAPPEKP